jgi:hypothetical protein
LPSPDVSPPPIIAEKPDQLLAPYGGFDPVPQRLRRPADRIFQEGYFIGL